MDMPFMPQNALQLLKSSHGTAMRSCIVFELRQEVFGPIGQAASF